MKISPELKAFRYHRKNINSYLDQIIPFWGDDKKREELLQDVASKFGADHIKFMEIIQISYERSVERAFK
jgi:hypothetical protein